MESSLLSTGAKVFTRSGTIRREQQELAPPLPRWPPVDRTCHVRCLKCVGGQEVERRGPCCFGKIEEDEEWKEMGKWAAEKCRVELGMVEMLECLEKEAIMGEDSGTDPADYDRRARIFDESSKVFQALRDDEDEDEDEEQHHRPSA